jgi:hypothetical protein
MKNNILKLAACLLVVFGACTDPEKDPFQFDKLGKGDILALRGSSFDNLFDSAFRGAIDSFNIATVDPNIETFVFDVEYLSDEPSSLSEVKVYARPTQKGARSLVATVPGSQISIKSGDKNATGTVSIRLADILNAMSKTVADFPQFSYIYIESDITLNNGTVVPASSVVNTSLFESAIFYPAHNLRYIAR